MTVRPTFLLGLGAMKAGTTWLHDQLAASDQVVTGYRKELHVLDVVDLPSESWMRARIAQRAQRAGRSLGESGRADAAALHQAAMVADVSLYPGYFAGLLAGGAALTLDITPSYALLDRTRLAWVRSSFAELGVRAVAAFLMRDPVERIWSHVRMVQGRAPEKYPLSSEAHLLELFDHPTYEGRTRYENTLAELSAAFPGTERHVGFYESLFTDRSVASISALCGIEATPGAFDVRANVSPRSGVLSESTVRRVARHYSATYDAVARACPEVDLLDLWPSTRLL
ncbi:hypothetical protein [Nocardioides sp. 1609]|uniref:hypothetical protein n=1 Tax=Nocardioides sp. 1609 TaxID=2508327 RepID=UPI0010702BC1|nr:hypothetical protein [Nocardioides sp. 1609]